MGLYSIYYSRYHNQPYNNMSSVNHKFIVSSTYGTIFEFQLTREFTNWKLQVGSWSLITAREQSHWWIPQIISKRNQRKNFTMKFFPTTQSPNNGLFHLELRVPTTYIFKITCKYHSICKIDAWGSFVTRSFCSCIRKLTLGNLP